MKVQVTTEKDGRKSTVEGDLIFSEDYKVATIVCDDYRTITIREVA